MRIDNMSRDYSFNSEIASIVSCERSAIAVFTMTCETEGAGEESFINYFSCRLGINEPWSADAVSRVYEDYATCTYLEKSFVGEFDGLPENHALLADYTGCGGASASMDDFKLPGLEVVVTADIRTSRGKGHIGVRGS